jgi:hypothetical protein
MFSEQVVRRERYLPGIREFEKWFTTGDAASALGKTSQGIKWLLENRRLRGARTRLGWLVDPKDVERYAREHGIEQKGENGG